MPDLAPPQKALLQQIIDNTLHSIEANPEFDAATVQVLRQLANKGELKKDKSVFAALRTSLEKADETH